MPASYAPVAHPLGPPTINGNEITVDFMLNQPTRVTRMIADLTLQRFIADRVFTSAGGVTGGALVYDQATANELFTARDIEQRAPGAEYPNVTSERQQPKIALVEDWGGKMFITDQARRRNNVSFFTNQVTKLANTIVRKINARVVETLDTAVVEHGQTTVGKNWSTLLLEGNAPTAPQNRPTADFAAAALSAMQDEIGVEYDLWILNPVQYTDLVIGYGDKLAAVLAANNLEVYASNRVTAGTGYAVASGQVGEMRVETPLATEIAREGAPTLRGRTWVQSSVEPVFAVTDPFAVLRFTGLAG